MKGKEPILVVGVLVFALILTLAVYKYSLQPKVNDKPTTSNQSHDETNSDGHHNSENQQDIGKEVDLTNQSQVSMNIKDYKYEKPNIKIKKGTTVTWTNQDAMQHNVMQDHSDSGTAHDAPTADQVKPDVFAGQLLSKGESYSFTFNEVSSAPYHCSPHPYMKGSVTVVE